MVSLPPTAGKHPQPLWQPCLGLQRGGWWHRALMESLLLPHMWQRVWDVPARAVSSWPQGTQPLFLFQLAGLGKLSLSSFHLLWRREEAKTKIKSKRIKKYLLSNNWRSPQIQAPDFQRCLCENRKDWRWEKKVGEESHYTENSLWRSREGGSEPGCSHWFELSLSLCSSGSFQVIALKIPYLQWLKIISSFLFIDLPLYFYDLPFPNIFQGFKNNNLSFFFPT